MALTEFKPDPTGAPKKPWRDVYSVTRLNREVRGLLEAGFPPLWIEAEISNLARPASGHLYFSLKDKKAQARCAMFKGSTYNMRFEPANGQQVLVQARVGLYEQRGEFQLVVEHMEPAGAGALQRAFEELKAKLDAEGLFASSLKKPLPTIPRSIGVVTSPTGAAIRDILAVLRRRFPATPVTIYPVPVQGEGSAQKIANAIDTADERGDCDVLIVARGGGSLEDLWAFNEEAVARAIYRCELPVISGVGHEVDISIADFCADLRAATPSAAAEAAVPDHQAWLERFAVLNRRQHGAMERALRNLQQRHDQLTLRLNRQHPQRRLSELEQKMAGFQQRLKLAQERRIAAAKTTLKQQQQRLLAQHPVAAIERTNERCSALQQRLIRAQRQRITSYRLQLKPLPSQLQHYWQQQQHSAAQRLANNSQRLHALSPLATLARGYAIARDSSNGLVTDPAQVQAGDRLQLQLRSGQLGCVVESRNEPQFDLLGAPDET